MSMNASFLSSPSHIVGIRSEMLHVLDTQSKTRLLPSELFSVIFQHACPTPDLFVREPATQAPPFHLVLRLVSTLWYDIVQSTPQLWNFVILPHICTENARTKGRFLQLCLDNSGCLPLTLSFQFDETMRKAGWFVSPMVDSTLDRSAHRIQALQINRPPRGWLKKLIPKMCQLAMIHINNPQPHLTSPITHRRDRRLVLPKPANLSRIHISYPYLVNFRLECAPASVTHVELRKLPIDFAIGILLQCPNLIDFSCLYLQTASKVKNPRTMFTSPLILNRLSSFTWPTVEFANRISEWDRALFEHIRFPALKRFNLAPSCYLPVDDPTFALSLSRFPKSVTTLGLHYLAFYPEEDTRGLKMFLPLAGVVQLRFLHCSHDFVGEAFSNLSHETDQSNILFPKLTSIVISCQAFEDRKSSCPMFDLESGNKLAQMLRSRAGFMDEFTLTAESAHLTRHWDDEVWRTLRELKRNGLDLNIIEYGRPIIF